MVVCLHDPVNIGEALCRLFFFMKFFYSYFLLGSLQCFVFFHELKPVHFFPLEKLVVRPFLGELLVLFIHLYILFWLVEGGLSCKLEGSIHHY